MVKAGDVVKVKVLEVDAPRKRIALTMRLDDQPGEWQAAAAGAPKGQAAAPKKMSAAPG